MRGSREFGQNSDNFIKKNMKGDSMHIDNILCVSLASQYTCTMYIQNGALICCL